MWIFLLLKEATELVSQALQDQDRSRQVRNDKRNAGDPPLLNQAFSDDVRNFCFVYGNDLINVALQKGQGQVLHPTHGNIVSKR